MEKCEIGAAAWGFRELDLEEQLKLCQRLGFSSLELGIANAPKDVPLDATDEEIQKVRELYQKYQMPLWCAATGNDFTVVQAVEEQIQKIKKVILICEKAGISYLRIFAGFSAIGEVTGERWKEMIRAINETADFAKEHQVIPAVETHGGVNAFPDGVVHFASVTTDYTALEKLLKEIRGNVLFVFDPANLAAAGEKDPLRVFRLLKDRIAYMHLKNFIKLPSGHLNPAPLGPGVFDWNAFVSRIGEWQGRYMIEFEKPEILERGCQESIDYLYRHQEG